MSSKKKNIAIVAGGNSSEYGISVKSAEMVYGEIDRERYNPYLVHIKGHEWTVQGSTIETAVNRENFSFVMDGEFVHIDCAVILIHGTPGENGLLQAYFDLLHIPYTTCDVLTSSLTFNKYFCKNYLLPYNIDTADSVLIRQGEPYSVDDIISEVGLPCFIKPNNSGSSYGVSKLVDKKDVEDHIAGAFKEDDEVIIEGFIKGTEITCGTLKLDNEVTTLPITEIVSKNDFFDYEAKYQGKSEEITPARIPADVEKACRETSVKIYKALNCNGIVRIDYIVSDGKLYFLEVNTVPGMSRESIIPQQIRTAGMTVKDVYSKLIDAAMGY